MSCADTARQRGCCEGAGGWGAQDSSLRSQELQNHPRFHLRAARFQGGGGVLRHQTTEARSCVDRFRCACSGCRAVYDKSGLRRAGEAERATRAETFCTSNRREFWQRKCVHRTSGNQRRKENGRNGSGRVERKSEPCPCLFHGANWRANADGNCPAWDSRMRAVARKIGNECAASRRSCDDHGYAAKGNGSRI